MRKFYIYFPIATTVSSQLSWSHYLELLKVDEEAKKFFLGNVYVPNDLEEVIL